LIACRILGSVGIAMIMCQGMPAAEVFAALRWARVPLTWIEIAVLMYRYIHIFFEQAGCVASAQKVRLGYSNPRRSFQSLGSLAGMVVLRALDQAEKSHEAMTARGYQGRLPLPALPSLPWRQAAVACTGVVVIAAAYILAERWPS
jgi:cobalt/nickel transport system permease protein